MNPLSIFRAISNRLAARREARIAALQEELAQTNDRLENLSMPNYSGLAQLIAQRADISQRLAKELGQSPSSCGRIERDGASA